MEEEHLEEYTNHNKLIIKELNKSYNSYIDNKKAIIEAGTLGITIATIGVATFSGLGLLGGVPLVIGSVLYVDSIKETYRKELLQALSVGELGNIAEIEKYYKQLPKGLREKWANDNAFLKLADHLKTEFPEDKIYNIDEVLDFSYQTLDGIEGDEWVVLSGNGEKNDDFSG